MKTYEYRCPDGHLTEREFPIGKSEKTIACACGLEAGKVLHFPAVYFRGPGFASSGGFYEAPEAIDL